MYYLREYFPPLVVIYQVLCFAPVSEEELDYSSSISQKKEGHVQKAESY